MTNGWFLVRAPRPPVDAPIEMGPPLAPSHGPRCGVVEAA
jgi:hypothetical protein